jgi:hypothetical protein
MSLRAQRGNLMLYKADRMVVTMQFRDCFVPRNDKLDQLKITRI